MGDKMKSYYDKDTDSLGISLDSECYEETLELCAGVFIDVDKDGKPIGVEILNVKDFMENRIYEIKLSMEIEIPLRENNNSIRRELKPFISKVKEVTGYELKVEKVEEKNNRMKSLEVESDEM